MNSKQQMMGKLRLVENSVIDTVEKQVEAHPYVLLGGSVLLGLVAGLAISHKPNNSFPHRMGAPSREGGSDQFKGVGVGNWDNEEAQWRPDVIYSEGEKNLEASSQSRPTVTFFQELADEFGDEIRMAKNVIAAALFSVVLKKASQKLPSIKRYLDTIVDSVESKLKTVS